MWVLFFFFKQKTAYEIGTGDWSSDVCLPISFAMSSNPCGGCFPAITTTDVLGAVLPTFVFVAEIGRASCRERV